MWSPRGVPRRPRRAGSAGWLLLAVLACSPVGCGLGSDRADQHVENAESLLAEGLEREALVELRAASQLRPDDRELSIRVARVAARHGLDAQAREYYADAHALDPTDDETALALARLLISDDPTRASRMVAAVLARDPRDARALLVKAEVSLASGQLREARTTVEQALRIAPDDPELHWALAQVHEARTRAVRTRSGGQIRDRRSLDLMLDAYDNYVEHGGELRVMAALNQARMTGVWTGLGQQADVAYRHAIDLAVSEGTPEEKRRVFNAATTYASGIGDHDLERLALEHWIETEPTSIAVWQRLADASQPEGGTDARRAVLERMLERNASHAGAHVAWARYLADTAGYDIAAGHLAEQIEAGLDAEVLLTGLLSLQYSQGRPRDAARTLARLQQQFGESPDTALLTARHLMIEHRADEAAESLQSLLERHETSEAWQWLARAEMSRQRYPAALVATTRAVEMGGASLPESLRLKARVHLALDESRKTVAVLSQLKRIKPLEADDQLLLARAHYRSSGAIHGRPILESMLRGPNPRPEAALELAHWEMENPHRRPAVRAHLAAVAKRYPANVEVLEALVRDDMEQERPKAALARVTRAIQRRPRDGRLYLVRARILMAMGRPGDAARNAQRAVDASPEVRDEGYELLARLYVSRPDPEVVIASLEKRDESGAASADDIALLARLYLQIGDREQARVLYERAIEAGSELSLLKNDLAFLLAESGEDLDRALELARDAANTASENLAATDTLGFVYLQSGAYDAAYWQFRFVTREANPPVAEYWYHLGLALTKLERHAEARDALAEALRIDPDYPPAANALSELDAASDPPPQRPS